MFKLTLYYLSVTVEDLNLLLPIKVAEIIECMCKYMDGTSQNLQSLSSYQPDPPKMFLLLRIMVKQVKSSS